MMRYLVLLLSAILLVSGCKSKEKEKLWGVYQEPIAPKAYPEDSGAVELQRLWRKNLGSGASSGYALLRATYDNGSVFAASRQGTVVRLDGESGKTLWSSKLGNNLFSGVGAGEQLAVVTMDNGNVVALSQEDGSVVWETSIRRQISAVPVVGKSRVVVRTADGLIIGLNAANGRTVWQLERVEPGLSIHGDSTPTIAGDAVFVGLSNGTLIANNVVNGRAYWEAEIAFVRGQNELERLLDSDTPVIVRGNTIYSAAYQGSVVAMQLQDAQSIWQTRVSTRLPMAITGEKLFVTTALGGIVALDTNTGQTLWEQKGFQGRGVSQPVAVGNRVVIGDSKGRIHTLDMESGALIESRAGVSGAVVAIAALGQQFTIFSSEGNIATYSL